MERYLNIDNIELALDGMENLPSAQELQDMMGEAEKMMFIRQGKISDELKTTGWYLHSVASAKLSLEMYSDQRIKRANQISAHIFDLVLDYDVADEIDRLSYAFAGQIGYLKGDLTPNATALYKKVASFDDFTITENHSTLALKLGIMFLALDRTSLFRIIPQLRIEIEEANLRSPKTAYRTLADITDAIWYMLTFVSYGNREHFLKAREILSSISRSSEQLSNLNTRWVAAHLMDINEYLQSTTLWNNVPPNIPTNSIRAMALGSPPILSLWPPQIHLLGGNHSESPLLLDRKRIFLSVPTSSGKTLLSQLFIVTHLAQNGGSVCVVAPSNSLCREIKNSLLSRLRFMNYNVADSLPDYYKEEERVGADIEVMTPERLNFLVRTDVKAFLDRFSLIVVDEAHLVGEIGRGWGLESTLSLLNGLTQESHHRIILMSSALGREGHIHHWLSSNGARKSFHSEWRGPRRLYAMYSADIDYSKGHEIVPPKTKRSHELHVFQLKGTVRLRIAETTKIHKVSLREPVGVVAIQADTGRRAAGSTPQYRSAVPFILGLGESGPVLIIETSKRSVLMMAKALAEELNEESSISSNIADFVTLRLGEEHPLTKVLRNGVAYHHAALPTDVQDAIEIAIKSGEIKYIVATTTLAEGINMPVRSVVISNIGNWNSEGEFEEYIKGPTLVNTIGRAGRAGKESEGWIILLGKFDESRLDQLINTKEEDMVINSGLSTKKYLDALEAFETNTANMEDAILEIPHSEVSDFISQVWASLAALENVNKESTQDDVAQFLNFTLAWKQLDEDTKLRWRNVADRTYTTYSSMAVEVRKRWAKTGTSVPSADVIEVLSREVFDELLMKYIESDDFPTIQDAFRTIFTSDRLHRLLSLPEHIRFAFKPYRSAPNDRNIEVDVIALLRDWMNGEELSVLVGKYLSEIDDIEYAYESLSTFLTSSFEHFLPWILNTMISWINNYEKELFEGRNIIDPYLAHYVKYGVDSHIAVNLMMRGIRSRRLANELNIGYNTALEDGYDLDSWLKSLTIDSLITSFGASLSEISDFKTYINPDDSTFLSDLIEREYSQFTLYGEYEFKKAPVVFKKSDTNNGNDSIFIQQDNYKIELPIEHHKNIEMLMETGIPFEAEVTDIDDFGISFTFWIIDFDQ